MYASKSVVYLQGVGANQANKDNSNEDGPIARTSTLYLNVYYSQKQKQNLKI